MSDLRIDIDAGYFEDDEEEDDDIRCPECDMLIHRHQRKGHGCIYCQPDEDEA